MADSMQSFSATLRNPDHAGAAYNILAIRVA